MEVAATPPNSTNQLDKLGKFASGLCALHCGLSAFLPGLFAMVGLEMLMGHEAEWVFTIIAVIFALGAMLIGWQKHRTPLIAGLFAVGIIGLLGSRFLEEMEGHEGHGDSVEHAEKENHGEEKKHAEKDEHDEKGGGKEIEGHGEHHELGLGIVVGLGSGALLVFSHFKNAASIRLSEEDCCQIPR